MDKFKSKRIIGSLLCMILMVLSLGGNHIIRATNGVASAGNTSYETLAEAMNQGGTVTLLQDVLLSESIKVHAETTARLDLNGHIITVTSNGGRSLYAIENYGDFTLLDSSVKQSGKIIARGVQNFNKMTMESGIIESCDSNGGGSSIWNEGSLFMSGGTLRFTGKAYGNNVGVPLTNNANAEMKVIGGTIETEYISIISSASTVIENVTIQSSTPFFNAIKVLDGETTLRNVNVHAINGAGGVETSYGTVNIYDSTFTQTGYYDHNSMNVAVSNYGTANIHSGTFTSENYGLYIFNSGGTMNVTQGTFKANKSVVKCDKEDSSIHIKDGNFEGNFTGKFQGEFGPSLTIDKGNYKNVGMDLKTFSQYISSYDYVALKDEKDDTKYHVGNRVKDVTIEPSSITIKKGDIYNITPVLTPTDAIEKITYTTEDNKVANVSDDGKIQAKSSGKTRIIAKAGNIEDSLLVNVYEVEEGTFPSVDPSAPEGNLGVDKESAENVQKDIDNVIQNILNGKDTSNMVDSKTSDRIKQAVTQGKTIVVKLQVESLKENEISEEEHRILAGILSKNRKVATYLDIAVVLSADGQKLGTIDSLSKQLKFTITIPNELKAENRIFSIIRIHEGKAETLDTSINSDGTLSFATDKFSTYILVYEDKDTTYPIGPTKPEDDNKDGLQKVETSDATSLDVYVMMLLISFAFATFAICKEKRLDTKEK